MWDRDYFSANDFMGEASFTYEKSSKEAWEQGIRLKKYGRGENVTDRMRGKKTDKFWLTL